LYEAVSVTGWVGLGEDERDNVFSWCVAATQRHVVKDPQVCAWHRVSWTWAAKPPIFGGEVVTQDSQL